MNKKDFLNELENSLEGKLPEPDIREVLSDYGDIFDNGMASGKSEEELSREIGSPAKIARTIMEEGADKGSAAVVKSGERQYTDFQKNINEKTDRIFDKVIQPDNSVDIDKLATMSRRLGAYIIDNVLLGAVTMGIIMVLFAPFLYIFNTSSADVHYVTSNAGQMGNEMMSMGFFPRLAFANVVVLVLLLGAFNLFTTIFIWATNGFTPGKWLLRMRVVKVDGSKIGFLDAILRELLIKCIANSVLSGFLNLGSFIWGCVTDDRKTVHDLVAKTRVVEWDAAGKHV